MAKYRKKPIVIEAGQWFMDGNNAQVQPYSRPDKSSSLPCEHCEKPLRIHGWITTLEGGHIVCPGDWIIRGVKGEFYPCKEDVFIQTYEPVEEE